MGKKVLIDEAKRRTLRIKRQHPSYTFDKVSEMLEEENLGKFKPRTLNAFFRNKSNKDAKEKILNKKVYTFQDITDIKWNKNKQN